MDVHSISRRAIPSSRAAAVRSDRSLRAGASTRLVRRNLPFVDPGSVRVTEEIVPRSVAGSIPDRSNPQAPYFNLVGGISPALRRGAEQQRAASRRMRSSDLINESLIEQDTKRIKAR